MTEISLRASAIAVALTLALLAPESWAQATAPTTKAPTTAAKQAAPVDPLKGLRVDHDKMKEVSWYHHATTPKFRNANGFYVYFGRDDKGKLTPLHLVVQYYADSWLFVKRAWAKADGVKLDLPQKTGVLGWEHDNGGGKIWEWSDASLTEPADIAAVRKLADAKDVTVRFEGRQYYNDKTLTAQQLKAMREVIAAYEGVSGKPWK